MMKVAVDYSEGFGDHPDEMDFYVVSQHTQRAKGDFIGKM